MAGVIRVYQIIARAWIVLITIHSLHGGDWSVVPALVSGHTHPGVPHRQGGQATVEAGQALRQSLAVT